MDVKEIRKAKEELELKLLTTIREFEQAVGATVSEVNLKHTNFMGRSKMTAQLDLRVEI